MYILTKKEVEKIKNSNKISLIAVILVFTILLSGAVTASDNTTDLTSSDNSTNQNTNPEDQNNPQAISSDSSNDVSPATTVNEDNIVSTSTSNAEPEIVITFDDGAKSVYTDAYPVMDQYGIKGTVFINPAYIGQDWYMSLADLQELHNAGWTIASHAYDHLDLTSLTMEQQVTEIQTAIDWLKNNGFADGAYYFASPYGAYNQEILDVLNQLGVQIHRTTNDGYISNPPADLLQLPDKEINGITGYHTLDQAKSIVDGTISTHATAFLLLHEIVPCISNDWQWSISNFSGLIAYIAQTGVKTLTVNDWYNELNSSSDTTPTNESSDSGAGGLDSNPVVDDSVANVASTIGDPILAAGEDIQAASETVSMQKTGIPIAVLLMAILALFGGLVSYRKL